MCRHGSDLKCDLFLCLLGLKILIYSSSNNIAVAVILYVSMYIASNVSPLQMNNYIILLYFIFYYGNYIIKYHKSIYI